MIKLSKPTTKRLLDIHGWSAVILGLALYVVVFTGAIVVFASEIGSWSVSGQKLDGALAGKVDAKLSELSQSVKPDYLDDLSFWQNSAGYLIVFFHTHVKDAQGQMKEKGTRFVLDPATMQVVSQSEGMGEDLPSVRSGYLEEFFADLHIKLHAPDPIGLYLTGILGLVLLILAISGFILHRHLIMDIFLSPRLSTRLLNTRDRHNLAGTWGIIFSFILAFSGAFFSFATTLGLPVIAITAFEGDRQKAIETILGVSETEDLTPSPFIGLETIVNRVRQGDAAGSVPRFIGVQHWGRADAKVMTLHEPNADTIFFTSHIFNGVSGEYLGLKPRFGTTPSLGDNLVGLMGVLHFGWFAGLLSKIIWLSLGLATCYVTLTGLQLWTQRRESEPIWQRLGRLTAIIGYGTPVAMCTAAIGFILSYARYPAGVEHWTINGFFIGVALSFVLGFSRLDAKKRDRLFQQLTGLSLLSLPFIRYWASGAGWSTQLANGDSAVVALDISFLISGIILLCLSAGWLQQKLFAKDKPSTAIGT